MMKLYKRQFILKILTYLLTATLSAAPKGWQEGKGWGWVWGADDEVGSLNEMTSKSILKALSLVKKGEVRDMGILYDRTSLKWPGHSPAEIITFRSPEGVRRQKDLDFTLPENGYTSLTTWHSNALFINDNVATQIDSLGHIAVGDDNHWYNGFTEDEWGGNWGIRKCGAETIPPVVARGVLIDVAGDKGLQALPSQYVITVGDLKSAL